MLHVMSYRLFRLRRLVAAGLTPPLLVWLLVYAAKGPVAMALLPLALLPVPAHVLRYPNAWMETLALSFTVASLLGLAATIGPDVSLFGLAFRLLGLAVLGLVCLAVLSLGIMALLGLGRARSFTTRSRRFSRLDPESLRSRITLFPGRSDPKVTCGPANADGMFDITLHHLLPGSFEEGTDSEAPFDIKLMGLIVDQSDTHHDLISIDPDTQDTTATRFHFEPTEGGTYVTLEERAVPLPFGYRAGYWLQDYLADYLTDEIERAEERTPVANRFASQEHLIFELAGAVFGTGADWTAE